MEIFEIPSHEMRLPPQALAALEQRQPVAVTRYGKRRHVVLSEEQFALVAPLLELLEEGASVPSELLMTEEDIALERHLAEDRQPDPAEDALIESALTDA